MYVEAYETSSKWTLFSNMRYIAMFITAVYQLLYTFNITGAKTIVRDSDYFVL